jgi:hypothetical protein
MLLEVHNSIKHQQEGTEISDYSLERRGFSEPSVNPAFT